MRDLSKQLRQVWDFQEAFLHPQTDSLDMGTRDRRELRYTLIDEEVRETIKAFDEHDYVGVLDGLMDQMFITLGSAHYHGMGKGGQFASFVKFSMACDYTFPEEAPVQTLSLLEVIKKDYINCKMDFKNVLSWNIDVCVSVLSCFNDLVNAGIFKEDCFDLAFTEVYHSNMSKLDEHGKPIFREDGKVLKGPNYFKPNLSQFINPKYL